MKKKVYLKRVPAVYTCRGCYFSFPAGCKKIERKDYKANKRAEKWNCYERIFVEVKKDD